MGPGPVWPKSYLAHDAKRSKPIYHIRTGGHSLDGESESPFERARVPSQRPASGNPSRVLSPPVGHPFAHGKFIMEKDTKTENTQRIFIS